MTLFKHEVKQNLKTMLIWCSGTIFMMFLCIILFPAFKDQQAQLNDVFKNLGAFSKAFGLDQLNFGTIPGFYGMECGQIIALGGGFFAAITGANALAKEENSHTAEFLLTHPINRNYIITSKLASVLFQIIVFNILVVLTMKGSLLLIGEQIDTSNFLLFHLVYLVVQIELASIGFLISAFVRRSGVAIGIGIAFMLYFVSIIAGISDKLTWLKYFTPNGMVNAYDTLEQGLIETGYVLSGIAISVVAIVIAYIHYNRKDVY